MSRAAIKEWVRSYYLRWIYFPLFPQARPRYFEDAWRYPRAKAGKRAAGNGRQFLFLPMTDWHTRIQRSQHLALNLAKLGHESVYLNPHLGREYQYPWRWGEEPVVCELAPGVSELHVHLPREPVFHERMLSASEELRLETALREAAPAQNLAVVVSFPLWLPAAAKICEQSGVPLVYDCHDLLDGFTGMAPEIVAKEAELLDRCDVAVFSSAHLMQKTLERRPVLQSKSILIRNGVDSAHFRGAAAGAQDGTVIGYAGALEEWFDAELIERAARAHPEWRFVLIGRVEHPSIQRLSALANVQLRGEVPYADLPKHAAEFTVGVIPFTVNQLTLAADPIKLYEYFSLGLPVVSTALPEVERHGDLVYVADRQSFIGQLEIAASEHDDQRRRLRQALADAESWDQRATALIAAVESAKRR